MHLTWSSPAALTRELAGQERDAATLERTLRADTSEHARLEEKARQECAGVVGSGLSGLAGVGDRCRRDRRDTDGFFATHRIAANTAKLSQLNGHISELRATLASADGDYQRAVNAEIDVDLEQHEHASHLRKHRQEIDVQRRRHEARIRADLAEVINARTADLLGQGRGAEQTNGHRRSPDNITESSHDP
jgi:hypothetical protein